MKAKLIKKGDVYFLDELKIDGYFTIANSLVKPNGSMYNLSIKNCQAIERGYDLDELSVGYASGFLKRPVTLYTPLEVNTSEVVAFQKGFQKAVELLGDKKFSEEDIHEAYFLGEREDRDGLHNLLQSLQHVEWEVEIEIFTQDDLKSVNNDWNKINTPKLDENGCLILKRI